MGITGGRDEELDVDLDPIEAMDAADAAYRARLDAAIELDASVWEFDESLPGL